MAYADLDHHLLLEQAGMMLAAGRLADARVAFQRSLDAAELAGDGDAIGEAVLGLADAEERAEVLAELVAVAARSGNPYLTLVGVLWTTIDAFIEGRPDAMRSLQHLRTRADELGNGVVRYVTRTIEVMTLLRAG